MAKPKDGKSKQHNISKAGYNNYLLTWVVDRKYKNSGATYSVKSTKETDKDGAEDFARKWGVKVP